MGWENALESVKTIKLSGGIFGKTTVLLVVLCICVAALTIKIGTWWFGMALMLPMMGIIFYALKRVLDFAESNPQAAIMEGAELLVHEKILHGTKDNDEIFTRATIDHTSSQQISTDEANQEDPPPAQELSGKEGE